MGHMLWNLLISAGLPLAALVAAAVLAGRAWRGRRVGEYPHCRRCDYDLRATPAGGRCPECGSELAFGAVVIGRPAASGPMFAAAAVSALVGIVFIAFVSRGAIEAIDWQSSKPVFLLRWEMGQGDLEAALELSRRLGSGRLSADQARAAAATALGRQADPAVTWHPVYGDIVEGARHRGVLGDEAWAAYARHAPQISIDTRVKARPGDHVPLTLWLNPSRLDGFSYNLPDAAGTVTMYADAQRNPPSSPWPKTEPPFYLWYHLDTYAVGDGPALPHVDRWSRHRSEVQELPTGPKQRFVVNDDYRLSLRIPPDTPIGPTTLRVTFDFRTVQIDGADAQLHRRPPHTELAAWWQTFEVPIEVVPEEAEVITLVSGDPALKEAVKSSIRRPKATQYHSAAGDRRGGGGGGGTREVDGIVQQRDGAGHLNFGFGSPPVPVGFRVYLRTPDGQRVSTIGHGPNARPGETGMVASEMRGHGVGVRIPKHAMDALESAGVTQVDILLEPSTEAVWDRLTIDQIFGEPLVIPDVPIVYHPEHAPAP